MKALDLHPVRYRKSRSFADRLVKFYRGLTDGTHLSESNFAAFTREFITHYNEALDLIPAQFRPDDSLTFANELNMFIAYAGFQARGRTIIALTPERAAALLESPAPRIRAGDIKAPFGVFHLAFGRQHALELSTPGYFVDGAYLNAEDPDQLEIFLTTSREDANYARPTSFILQRDLHYDFDLPLEERDATPEEAVDRAVNEPESIFQREPTVNAAYADKVNAHLTDSGAGVRVASVGNTASKQARQAWENLDTFRRTLPLIINALAFLHDDAVSLEETYPSDAPPALLADLRPGVAADTRAAAERKLERLGFPKLLTPRANDAR